MSDIKKRILSGIIFAFFFSFIIHYGTRKDTFLLTNIINRYEHQSYDVRLKASVADVEESTIDEVVIIC